MIKRSILPFVVSVFCVMILPDLFREGMFMDGTLYTDVSLNFARGNGSFWQPHFAKVSMPFFHEQPPLMFGLLGIFFKLFGYSIYTERAYTLFMFTLTLILFIKTVKLLQPSESDTGMAVLFWISFPIVSWMVINNMEENTMTFFSLGSIYFFAKAFRAEKIKLYLFTFISSFCLIAAFLTKGFPGLYPLVLPALLFVFESDKSLKVKYAQAQISVLLFITVWSLLLYAYEPSRICLSTWLSQRVLNSIQHVSNSSSRFEIIWILFQQMIPALLICGIIFLTGFFKKIKLTDRKQLRTALVFFILGLCGSVPLMITREQRTFYLGAALPSFAIAFYLLTQPLRTQLAEWFFTKKTKIAIQIITALLFITSLTFMFIQWNIPKREAEKIADIKIITSKVPYGEIMYVPHNMWNDWELHTQLNRKNYVSLTEDKNQSKWLITDPPEFTTEDTLNYVRMNWNLKNYTVYQKIK